MNWLVTCQLLLTVTYIYIILYLNLNMYSERFIMYPALEKFIIGKP